MCVLNAWNREMPALTRRWMLFLLLAALLLGLPGGGQPARAGEEAGPGGYVLLLHENQRVASLQISPEAYRTLVSPGTFRGKRLYEQTRPLTRFLYTRFEDRFDHIFFLVPEPKVPKGMPYGVNSHVSNRTRGIGRRIFDNTDFMGSAGRLKGVLFFNSIYGLMGGPGLHELFHTFGNAVVPTVSRSHWGFSSVGGQAGGFQGSTLKDLGGGRYQATNGKRGKRTFGLVANGGNTLPYAPLELYLMGLVGREEVPPIVFFPDGDWVDRKRGIFTASDKRTLTIEDIIRENGERVPGVREAQKAYRALVVILSPRPVTDAEWALVDSHAGYFSHQGKKPGWGHNFWTATRGLATIQMDRLQDAARQPIAVRRPIPTTLETAGEIAPQLLLRVAKEHYRRDEYPQAVAAFSQVLRINPDLEDAYYMRGYSYDELKRYEEAMADFTQVIRLNPDRERAYLYRAHIRYRLSRYREAIADYTEVIRINPRSRTAHEFRASSYEQLRDTGRAREDYRRACDLGLQRACANTQ